MSQRLVSEALRPPAVARFARNFIIFLKNRKKYFKKTSRLCMQSFIKISHGVPDTQNVQTDKRSLLLGFLKYTLLDLNIICSLYVHMMSPSRDHICLERKQNYLCLLLADVALISLLPFSLFRSPDWLITYEGNLSWKGCMFSCRRSSF